MIVILSMTKNLLCQHREKQILHFVQDDILEVV